MAGAAVRGPGNAARKGHWERVMGLRSGLNKGSMASLFGTSRLQGLGMTAASTGRAAWAARDELRGGIMRGKNWAAPNGAAEATESARKGLKQMGKSMGSEAAGWLSATDRAKQGWGRARAIAARGALAYGALNVADFLNPFGFGSIDD